MSSKTRNQALSLVLMMLFAATAAAEHSGAEPAPAAQGQQIVVRDPATGKLRAPTEAEMAELSRAIEQEHGVQPRSGEAGPVKWRKVSLPNGVEIIASDEPVRQQAWLVVERGADGEYRMRHADAAASSQGR